MSVSALTVEIAPHTVQSVTVLTRNAPENRFPQKIVKLQVALVWIML